MKMPSGETPEQLALHQVHAVCLGHVEALQDALQDMAHFKWPLRSQASC